MASFAGGPGSAGDADTNNRTAPGNAPSTDPLAGRPDLEKDALKELRARQRALKAEAKRVATDLKNKKKQKKRALKRCATLDARDIVQVLLERGIVLQPRASSSTSSASSTAAPSEPDAGREGADDQMVHVATAIVPHVAGDMPDGSMVVSP